MELSRTASENGSYVETEAVTPAPLPNSQTPRANCFWIFTSNSEVNNKCDSVTGSFLTRSRSHSLHLRNPTRPHNRSTNKLEVRGTPPSLKKAVGAPRCPVESAGRPFNDKNTQSHTHMISHGTFRLILSQPPGSVGAGRHFSGLRLPCIAGTFSLASTVTASSNLRDFTPTTFLRHHQFYCPPSATHSDHALASKHQSFANLLSAE